MADLRRRDGGGSEVHGEEEREPPQQPVPGSRVPEEELAAVPDRGVVLAKVLRCVRREAPAGG